MTTTPINDLTFDLVWYWRVLLGERKGHACRIVSRERRNRALVEFRDGLQVLTSGFAVRRPEPDPWPCLHCGTLTLLGQSGLVCPGCDAKVVAIDAVERRRLKRRYPERCIHA